MAMSPRAVAALLMVVVMAACGTAPGTRSVPGSGPRLISESDVRASTAPNVLQPVQQMRPDGSWSATRGRERDARRCT